MKLPGQPKREPRPSCGWALEVVSYSDPRINPWREEGPMIEPDELPSMGMYNLRNFSNGSWFGGIHRHLYHEQHLFSACLGRHPLGGELKTKALQLQRPVHRFRQPGGPRNLDSLQIAYRQFTYSSSAFRLDAVEVAANGAKTESARVDYCQMRIEAALALFLPGAKGPRAPDHLIQGHPGSSCRAAQTGSFNECPRPEGRPSRQHGFPH